VYFLMLALTAVSPGKLIEPGWLDRDVRQLVTRREGG
jgi:hypothetical protein